MEWPQDYDGRGVITMEPNLFSVVIVRWDTTTKASITNYLRDFGPGLEKYKAVQIYHV